MSEIEIRDFELKDMEAAVRFGAIGMNLINYVAEEKDLDKYAHWFFDYELNRATGGKSAYVDGEFAGVLLYRMKREKRKYFDFKRWLKNLWQTLVYAQDPHGESEYRDTNKEFLRKERRHQRFDGEFLYFAADPDRRMQGIGSAMLKAMEKEVAGKNIYLFTDTGCNFGFYEKRGFTQHGCKMLRFSFPHKEVTINCFMYTRHF